MKLFGILAIIRLAFSRLFKRLFSYKREKATDKSISLFDGVESRRFENINYRDSLELHNSGKTRKSNREEAKLCRIDHGSFMGKYEKRGYKISVMSNSGWR